MPRNYLEKGKKKSGEFQMNMGLKTKEADDVEKMFCNYFTQLLITTNPSQIQIEYVFQDMSTRVIREMT